jgi:GNAT superfamily N-acetyltransferase
MDKVEYETRENNETREKRNADASLFRVFRYFHVFRRFSRGVEVGSHMQEINLRLAQMEDIPALEELLARSVRGLSVGYYTWRQIESALVHIFGIDTQLILDGVYYVAQSEGRIVGCGGWSRRRTLYGGDQTKSGEDSILDPRTEAARIRAFFIDPDYARRGIGRRIIEACESAAGDAGFKTLELGATLPGEPMYRALGYAPFERVEEIMPDGEVLALVKMRKTIER